jgi:hypothetical protein
MSPSQMMDTDSSSSFSSRSKKRDSNSKGRAELLENILHDPQFTGLSYLSKLRDLEKRLEAICDVSEDAPGMHFIRLNDEKVRAWLKRKVIILAVFVFFFEGM